MKKGFLGVVLLSGLFLTPITAYADSNSAHSSLGSNVHATVTLAAKPPYKSNGHTSVTITPNSTTAPTQYWSISSQGTYNGSFTGVSNVTGIYTNYYFLSSPSNQLIVDTSVTGENSATTQYFMELLDKSEGGAQVGYQILPCGQAYTVTFSNLNPFDYYYVGWGAVGNYQYIDGFFDVHY